MSNFNQCSKCGRNYVSCEHLDNSGTFCNHYIAPRDNSKMFTGFFGWEGRYSRAQYIYAVLISIAIYLLLAVGGGYLLGYFSAYADFSYTRLIIFSIAAAIIPTCIIIVAGIKRTHDIAVPWYWSVMVVLPFWWTNLFTIGIGLACFIFLVKDKGLEGINEHGSNPAQPYNSQLEFEE